MASLSSSTHCTETTQAQKRITCPICHTFAARNLKGIVRHIGSIHAFEPGFSVVCGLGSCPRTYRNYHGYRKHLYQKHPHFMQVTTKSSTAPSPTDASMEDDEEEYDLISRTEQPQPCRTISATALFLLKASAVGKMPKSNVNFLAQDIPTLIAPKLQSL